MASVEIAVKWDLSKVEITESSSMSRYFGAEEEAPAGLFAIAVVRACDASGISIEDLGKQLIEESMRRREGGS
jgi:3-oxoacyl-[acyl-carrier-protein] synthase III